MPGTPERSICSTLQSASVSLAGRIRMMRSSATPAAVMAAALGKTGERASAGEVIKNQVEPDAVRRARAGSRRRISPMPA